MNFFYKKNKNEILFNSFETFGLKNCQNYIPIYSRFFNLTENNYNSINLNHIHSMIKLNDRITENEFKCDVLTENDKIIEKNIFIKFSPLLDPLKYMRGSEKCDTTINILPKLNGKNLEKMNNLNNVSYVDSFFYFLTSKLLNENKFLHGIDFFGSFLSMKEDYLYNAEDEGEYLYESEFFKKNIGTLFDIMDCDDRQQTRINKDKINVLDNIEITIDNEIILENTNILEEDSIELLFDTSNNNCETESDSESDSESESESETNDSDTNPESETDAGTQEEWDDDEQSVEDIICKIKNFPVQIIAIEKCNDTLDALLEGGISDEELTSAIFQVLMILNVYQKTFSFTHNDLHTNNIMYTKTDKVYICYKWKDRYYKVPSFGRIFKIIDFGRAIYKFQDKTFCSDSFYPKGDAATQYNFEPFYNPNKPRVEPNFSFDLCRLSCSIYDMIEDNEEEIYTLIKNWCLDDKEKNILYKKNGEERYPDFKLYKMIARNVHNHIPENELQKPLFDVYKVAKNKINKKTYIMNIDTLLN